MKKYLYADGVTCSSKSVRFGNADIVIKENL